ncbi:MAG: hypothetical protein K2J88_00020 [Oscillospiraceae bacterium]|nr:hypothetical protein [Oscillospiraceae bacterium]
MPRPELEKIIELLKSGEPFSLTNSQYKNKTGLPIPKNNAYVVRDSAVARKAKEYGYKVKVQERTISFEKEEKK